MCKTLKFLLAGILIVALYPVNSSGASVFRIPYTDSLIWVGNNCNIVCDPEGLTVEGLYFGRGSIVEIVDSSPSGVYVKIRVIKFVQAGSPPPIGWKRIIKENEEAWTIKNGLEKGSLVDYANSIDLMNSLKKSPAETIDMYIDQELKDEAADFFANLKVQYPFFDSILSYSRYDRFDLTSRIEHSLNEIFYLLSLTDRGREFLKTFLPKFGRGDVKILSTRSEKAIDLPSPPGSLAFYFQGTIYVDFESDLTRLLPIFVHEGTHAIDLAKTQKDQVLGKFFATKTEHDRVLANLLDMNPEELSQNDTSRLTALSQSIEVLKSKEEEILLASEHKAFRAHISFIDNMAEVFPEYLQALNVFIKNREWKVYPFDEDDFRITMEFGYNISENSIDKYFNSHNWLDFE